MCLCTIAGLTAGLALIVSGVREKLYKAPNYPRWTLDTSARERAQKAARTRKVRARLRYHLVAVNTALEGMDRWYGTSEDMSRSDHYMTMVAKREAIESVLYS